MSTNRAQSAARRRRRSRTSSNGIQRPAPPQSHPRQERQSLRSPLRPRRPPASPKAPGKTAASSPTPAPCRSTASPPASNYTFQVRAIGGSTGYSDWSMPGGAHEHVRAKPSFISKIYSSMTSWIFGEIQSPRLAVDTARARTEPAHVSTTPAVGRMALGSRRNIVSSSSILARTAGLALVTTFTFHPVEPVGALPRTIENSHVFGFPRRSKLRTLVDTRISDFFFLAFAFTSATSSAGDDRTDQCGKSYMLHAGDNSAGLIPNWARSSWTGWFWLVFAAAASLWSFGFQVGEARKGVDRP